MSFEDVAAAKRAIRRRFRSAREALTPDRVSADADRLSQQVLALPELAGARTVATYYSIDNEPGTRPLIAALLDSGRRLLLPVLRDDFDLDWAELTDPGELAEARMGLREPTGPRLGTAAIERADLVLCPGLAVDAAGGRLGRGAGCYDRALRQARPVTPRCIIVYDEEVVESVPVDEGDESVDLAVTPLRTLRLRDPSSRVTTGRSG